MEPKHPKPVPIETTRPTLESQALSADWETQQRQTIDGAVNSPVKLITIGVLAMEPGYAFAASDLGKIANSLQGREPVWLLQGSGYARYCTDSLEPAGLVTLSRVPSQRGKGKFVDAYAINGAGIEVGLPHVGGVLGWELRHQGTSVQRILGATNSPEDIAQRAPSTRLAILKALTESPDGTLARVELGEMLNLPASRYQGIIDWLVNQGVLVQENRYDPQSRVFHLSSPDYRKLRRHANPRVETKAAYGTASELIENGQETVTGRDFLDKALTMYPDLDRNLMWKRLVQSISTGRSDFIGAEPFDDDPRIHTRLSIAADQQEAIVDLLDVFSRLQSDTSYQGAMREAAYRIISDPQLVRQLMRKARLNSTVANALEPAGWEAVLRPIIAEGGINGLDINTLYASVKDAGHKVSRRGFGAIIHALSAGDDSSIVVSAEKGASKVRGPLGRVVLRSLLD